MLAVPALTLGFAAATSTLDRPADGVFAEVGAHLLGTFVFGALIVNTWEELVWGGLGHSSAACEPSTADVRTLVVGGPGVASIGSHLVVGLARNVGPPPAAERSGGRGGGSGKVRRGTQDQRHECRNDDGPQPVASVVARLADAVVGVLGHCNHALNDRLKTVSRWLPR